MEAIEFRGVNTVLVSKDLNVKSLPVYTDGSLCVMGFKLSPAELKEVRDKGEIWLVVHHKPGGFPPISIQTEFPLTYNHDTETEKETQK